MGPGRVHGADEASEAREPRFLRQGSPRLDDWAEPPTWTPHTCLETFLERRFGRTWSLPSQSRAFAVPAVDEGSWVVSRGASLEEQAVGAGVRGRVEADAPRTFSIGRGKRYEASVNRGQLDPEAFWPSTAPPTAVRMDDIMRLYAYKLT